MREEEAVNLLPNSARDRRGESFIRIVHQECQYPPFLWQQEGDNQLIRAIASFAPLIAPFASRLSVATQRQLLKELPELTALAGTVYSVKRTLELFDYTLVLVENQGTMGTYEIRIVQTFNRDEVQAIASTFAPIGRILTSIRGTTAILLDGTRFFDGNTTLSG